MSYSVPFVTDFGTVLGVYQDVEARSNGSDYHFSRESNYTNGSYTGVKYQCVEFARRWLLLSKGLEFHPVPIAAHIWNIKSYQRVSDGRLVPVTAFPNGSSTPPVVDSIIIWKVATEVPAGHIAVITEVNLEQNYVRVAEQNVDNDHWPGNYAREFKLEVVDGRYSIVDEDEMYGWLVFSPDIDDKEEITTPVQLVSKDLEKDSVSWLDHDNLVQRGYKEIFGDALASERSLQYFTMDAELAYRIQYATMEVLSMVWAAVNHIVKNPEVLARFGLPSWTWPLISQSWNHYWTSSGKQVFCRLQFGIQGKNIKLLEVAGDTTEGLLEAAVLQDKYAAHHGLDFGRSTAQEVNSNIVNPCANAINGFVHIYVDSSPQNEVRALYIRELVAETGHDSKVIRGISGVHRNEEGKFFDSEGLEIRIVWKVGEWEKVFEDYERDREGDSVRISDLLLSQNVRVLEPLWKVVVSSAALLPVLWELNPNSRVLMRAEWNTDGYFSDKPSVKKTYGGELGGAAGNCVYVEEFETERFGEYAPVIHAWSFMRSIAGFIVVDSNQRSALPFMCCRVVEGR